MQGLKLASLNIEGDRHLPQVVKFLKQEQPDVVCLQEVLRDHCSRLTAVPGYRVKFFPMAIVAEPTIWARRTTGEVGVAILTKRAVLRSGAFYYDGGTGKIPVFTPKDFNRIWRVLAWVEIEEEGKTYTIATTHFTWSPKGKPNEKQRKNLICLLEKLQSFQELVFCGDFNAPRGGEIWEEFAKRYTDHLPSDVNTTIDPNLHRHGALQLVVDGLFSTPNYHVGEVRVAGGISDHMAVMGTVTSP